MATRAKKKKEASVDPDREFLDLAMKRLKSAIDAENHNVSEALSDLKFLNGDQWDDEEKQRRKRRKRPMITINMLPDKVDRVVGDMRQNRARVKIRPASSEAQVEIAKIREGMISDIEYRSNASSIYDYAGGRAVECGHGAWRVLTRFCDDNPFIQEIYLEVIKNSFQVHLDPRAKDHCKADAKWGFICEKLTRDEFEETYPGAEVPGDSMDFGEGMGYQNWFDGELITVAEYFVVEEEKKNLCLMSDGSVITRDEVDSKIAEQIEQGSAGELGPLMPDGLVPPPSSPGLMVQGVPPKPQVRVLKEKEVGVPRIRHYVITANEKIKGPEDVPGKYIPIVVVLGKERNIEGKDYIRGLVRDGKDPLRLVNYWNTSAAETVALAPKAPWVGTAKQFENYEEDYANANQENFPYLKYNPDPLAPGPPVRTHAGDPPVAMFTQIQIAERNFHTVVGIGPDMRDVAPDASQKALIQRQKPAELATFPFVDNLSQAIAYSGKIINEMLPEVCDTSRDATVRGPDGSETFVPINTTVDEALKMIKENPERYQGMDASKLRSLVLKAGGDARFNDIGVGRYGVVVDVGPSYSTQRQEAADSFVMLAQTNPDIWKVAGDLIVKALDVNGADEMADRIRKSIPPGLITPKPGEPPPPPPQPSPEMQMVMSQIQLDTVKMQTEQIKQQKEVLNARIAMIKLYKETQETDTEIRKEILKVLGELHSPHHPADDIVFDENGPGGTPLGMPGKVEVTQ